MNFMDYCFIAILLLSGFAGMYQGLVRTVIGTASIFITFFISISYYPLVANVIKYKTPVYGMLKESALKTMNNSIASIPGMDKLTQLNDGVLNMLTSQISVPPVLRRFLINQIHVDVTNINTAQILDMLSTRSADIFVNIMGFILLFASIQFILTLIQNALGVFFSLPILNEINILGGFALGVVQGVITLFVICAAWSMLSGASMYKEVFVDLNASKYAKWFYDNNLLLEILVKYKII